MRLSCIFFLITISFLSSIPLKATHFTSAFINYKTQRLPSGALEVEVLFGVLRDTWSSAFPGTTLTLTYSSACDNFETTFSVNQDSINNNMSAYGEACLSGSAVSTNHPQELWYYSGSFTLSSSQCAKGDISYSECCRPGDIVNLGASTGRVFVSSRFNLFNNQQNNSNPAIPIENLWAMGRKNGVTRSGVSFLDQEGDSLYIALGPSLSTDFGSPATPNPIPFAAGYTQSNPLNATLPISVNPDNGLFTFIPRDPMEGMVSYRIKEFRFDTILNVYHQIGLTIYDQLFEIFSEYSGSAIPPLQTAEDSIILNNDTLGYKAISCGDSIIRLKFNSPLDLMSVSPNGSEFRLWNTKQNSLIPIDSIIAISPTNGFANELDIKLNSPLAYNDTLLLEIKRDMNGETFINFCGSEIDTGAIMIFSVSGCSFASVEENGLGNDVRLYPNPVKDYVTIKVSSLGANIKGASITNAAGQNILRFDKTTLNGNARIPTKELQTGLYFLTVSFDDGSLKTKRFIKE